MRFHNYIPSDPDLKIHFENVGPILEIWPRKGAPTLLFYPGTMLAPGHYHLLLHAFWQAGFAIAALNLKGHGRDKKFCLFTFEDMLNQGLAAEEWLLRNGFGPVVVSGHSQGGILTLAHAGASMSLAGAFALCAAFPQAPEAIGLTHFAPLAAHRQKIMKFVAKTAHYLPFLPVILPMYISLRKILASSREPLLMGIAKNRLTYPLVFMASLFNARVSENVHCPFHLMAAKNDALFTPEITETTFARIIAPRKQLSWLDYGGHLAPLNPDLCAQIAVIARAWLAASPQCGDKSHKDEQKNGI